MLSLCAIIPLALVANAANKTEALVQSEKNRFATDKEQTLHRDILTMARAGLILGLCALFFALYQDSSTIQQGATIAMIGSGALGLLSSFLFWVLQEIRRIFGKPAR